MTPLQTQQATQGFDLYFGTYTNGSPSEGIYHSTLDAKTGKLSTPELVYKTSKPSFIAIHPNGKHLYAVTEGDPGKINAFVINPETKKLKLINSSLSGGKGPCHVSVSKDGKTLLSANYISGSLASIPINADGSLGKPATVIQHRGSGVDKQRQKSPHAHSINLSPDNRFVYVADLGIDKIMIYKLDSKTSKLTPNDPACFKTNPGAGPRHFTFHPNEKFAYLINELDNTIVALLYDKKTGKLTEIQTVSTLPDDYTGVTKAAEVKVHPNGKFLYGSNRGHDSIVVYKINPGNGKLTLVGFQNADIKNPRHFNIDPSGKFCIVGNKDADNILLFEVDRKTGLLTSANTTFPIGKPSCIKFFPDEKRYNIWIISGEESGDIYGSRLINELKTMLPADKLSISAMGGARIAETGANLMVDSTELGVVGIFEIMGMIGTFIRIFQQLVRHATKERPDAVILIDYPGFNLRFAAKLYKLGIPVIWYITPQVWAWKKSRIAKLAKYCTKMMVIFPFETDVYAGSGLDTEFVGHPLVDVIKDRTNPEIKRDPNRFLLLPGSRKNEINRLFVPMLETACKLHQTHPELKFTVSAPRKKVYDRLMKIYESFCENNKKKNIPEIDITYGNTGRWMQEAGTGLAASGTVTVECAIAGLPLTVVYKLNPLTFFLAKLIVDIPFFTMVNIIAGKLVFEEFLQGDVNAETLSASIEKILPCGERRREIETDIKKMTESLSTGSGNASAQAAECVLKILKGNRKKISVHS